MRDQNVIPLPCPRTVRRYLSCIKSPCGFDDQFFQLFKKKITMLSKEQKHGILLFDEIILRESIAVKSSNLSYVGFENFGNEIHASNTKANHGLVFMFQSLSVNFCQPVGVFTSTGTVKGVFTITHYLLY